MPRSKNKQPKKLPTLTQKELREINIQQDSTKTAISKAAVARYLYIYPKMHFYAHLWYSFRCKSSVNTFLCNLNFQTC